MCKCSNLTTKSLKEIDLHLNSLKMSPKNKNISTKPPRIKKGRKKAKNIKLTLFQRKVLLQFKLLQERNVQQMT